MRKRLPKGWTAVDPDGYKFWYEKRPELKLNFEKVLTWVAESGSKCIFVERIAPTKVNFESSLEEIK